MRFGFAFFAALDDPERAFESLRRLLLVLFVVIVVDDEDADMERDE